MYIISSKLTDLLLFGAVKTSVKKINCGNLPGIDGINDKLLIYDKRKCSLWAS